MADKNEEMTIPESEKNVSAATAEETAPSAEETVTETTTGQKRKIFRRNTNPPATTPLRLSAGYLPCC